MNRIVGVVLVFAVLAAVPVSAQYVRAQVAVPEGAELERFPLEKTVLTVGRMAELDLRPLKIESPWVGYNHHRELGRGEGRWVLETLPAGTLVLVTKEGAIRYKADCGNRLVALPACPGCPPVPAPVSPTPPVRKGITDRIWDGVRALWGGVGDLFGGVLKGLAGLLAFLLGLFLLLLPFLLLALLIWLVALAVAAMMDERDRRRAQQQGGPTNPQPQGPQAGQPPRSRVARLIPFPIGRRGKQPIPQQPAGAAPVAAAVPAPVAGGAAASSTGSPVGGQTANEPILAAGEVGTDGTITITIPPEFRRFTVVRRHDGAVSVRLFPR